MGINYKEKPKLVLKRGSDSNTAKEIIIPIIWNACYSMSEINAAISKEWLKLEINMHYTPKGA